MLFKSSTRLAIITFKEINNAIGFQAINFKTLKLRIFEEKISPGILGIKKKTMDEIKAPLTLHKPAHKYTTIIERGVSSKYIFKIQLVFPVALGIASWGIIYARYVTA